MLHSSGMETNSPPATRRDVNTQEGIRMMKSFVSAVFFAVVVGLLQGQPTTSSPDPKGGVEMTGTIKEYTAGTALVVETLAPNEPVQFKLSKTISYADADGKTLDAPGLTTHQKVRVHYIKVGGDNVADKITMIRD